MKFISHAWMMMLRSLGGASLFYYIIPVPIVGFGIHYVVAGRSAMSEEVTLWLVSLASIGVVFSTLFLWHLVCAPYRIEREEGEKAEKELDRLRDEVSRLKSCLEAAKSNPDLERLEGRQSVEFIDRKTGETLWSRLK